MLYSITSHNGEDWFMRIGPVPKFAIASLLEIGYLSCAERKIF